MGPVATLLWLCTVALSTGGQLFFKAAAILTEDDDGLARWRKLLSNPWLWAGVGIFALEFLFWLAFLSLVPLFQAVLVASVNILLVMLGGKIFFNEHLTGLRVGAIVLVASGVALVGWG